jgi:hypothetical protein
MARAEPAAWTSAQALDAVRPQIRDALQRVPSFAALPVAERQQLARDMVKVMSYIADPNGVSDSLQPRAAAMGQADSIKNFRNLTSGLPDQAGKNFVAGATVQGVQQFGALVQKVDFPQFVGGLIRNVFQAIVESSLQQMRAYGELIANVAKTVDQFMQDNIGPGAGRDYLANRYPDDLAVEISSSSELAEGDAAPPTARVVARNDDSSALERISGEMNVNPPVTDLSDTDSETRLVAAARLQLARQRQQLLSSMVMLGISRIVVTDGSINAKVVFDMRASDTSQIESRASMFDRESQMNRNSFAAGMSGWGPAGAFGMGVSNVNVQEHMATVSSAVDESSESKAEVKAKLSGDVRVNFKSDYLPLEKMATPEMMSIIEGNSLPYNPNKPTAAAATTPAAGQAPPR